MSEKNKRMAEHWDSYALQVMSAKAGETQRREMRLAFYAGAIAYNTALRAITADPGLEASTRELVEVANLDAELRAFVDGVKAGRI